MSHLSAYAATSGLSPDTLAFLGLTEWWDGLDTVARAFAAIGLVAGAVTLVLLILTIFGLDHGGVTEVLDVDMSADTDVHADGSLFSTRSISGFFLGFGGGASIAYEASHNVILSSAIGFAVGLAIFYSIYFIAKKLLSLQSDGTVDFAQAVGSAGSVYISIPPARASGGQAQVVFNNRHEVIDVVTDSDTTLPAGTSIRVKQRLAERLFLVEPL